MSQIFPLAFLPTSHNKRWSSTQQIFRNSTPGPDISYTRRCTVSRKTLNMRRTISWVILVLGSVTAFCQSSSPDSLYERGMDAITGIGPSRNDLAGIDYFRRSSDLGYGPAQLALGYYYETGTLVAASPGQAVELYRKAAQTGDPLAAWLAGRHYFLGNGIPRDLDAARKWLKLAADQNNPFGAYYLGRLLADRDYTKAPRLYKIAADQGLPQAQYYYAKTLKEGRGIPQDKFASYIWYSIAADAGYTAANSDLNDLDSRSLRSELAAVYPASAAMLY